MPYSSPCSRSLNWCVPGELLQARAFPCKICATPTSFPKVKYKGWILGGPGVEKEGVKRPARLRRAAKRGFTESLFLAVLLLVLLSWPIFRALNRLEPCLQLGVGCLPRPARSSQMHEGGSWTQRLGDDLPGHTGRPLPSQDGTT